MRLSYLSAAALFAFGFATLSGGDGADSNLVKRKRGVGDSGSTSSKEAPPRKKPAFAVQRGLGGMPGNPKDGMKSDEATSPDIERLGVLGMSKEEFNELNEDKKIELTKDLSADKWNELLGNFWVKNEDNERNISIISHTLHYDQGRRLEMLKEALENGLKYLFRGMSHLAYVPDTPKVMPLLEQGLKVYPGLRHWILPTIYQLGYPTTKWHLDKSEEDLDFLEHLFEKEWIKREEMTGHLGEIVTLYPLEVLNSLLAKSILAREDVCTMELYRTVCGLGGIEYLRWANNNCGLGPDQGCIDAAVSGGHGNVVELIAEQPGMTLVPSQEAVNKAAGNGMLELLMNYCLAWGRFPNVDGANEAVTNGHLDMLKWLARQRVHPNHESACWAAHYGHLDVLKWLAERGKFPAQWGADQAAWQGHLDVLKWLVTLEPEECRVYPSRRSAEWAATNGHLHVLKWLVGRVASPEKTHAYWAARNGHLDVVKWLAEQGVYPSQHGADDAAENGHLHVLKWLAEQEIYPSRYGANKAAQKGHSDIVKWLNLLPRQECQEEQEELEWSGEQEEQRLHEYILQRFPPPDELFGPRERQCL